MVPFNLKPKPFLVGLLVDCPFESNPADCQLHDIRKQPLPKRMAWANLLSDRELREIISCHQKCLAHKEGRRGWLINSCDEENESAEEGQGGFT